jgi:DNA-binding response OmpR family regulator
VNRSVDGSPCVLFVDDEEMTRKTFERIASQEFPVLLAGDVAEAKSILEERGEDIGVLLTDQRMPGGLGVELLEYARDQHPNIVRMLTTAYSELEDAIAAVNRGEIIRYIEKPWNNIDALLIDLRVAMRFHQLERANQELMAEKMSAKARGARVERLQVLAALAASEKNSSPALAALESMLRSLAELRKQGGSGQSFTADEIYSGPVEETNSAIALAARLSEDLAEHHGNKWSDLSSLTLSGDAAEQGVPNPLSQVAAELFARAEALLSGGDSSGVTASVDSGQEGLSLTVSKSEKRNDSLGRWVNRGSDETSTASMADLMKLYFLAYPLGAKIDIFFDEDDALSELKILFSDLANGPVLTAQESDWLEDMIILFT